MKISIKILFVLTILTSCNSKQEMPEFITDDQKKTEEFADKAIQEAEQLLDSLEKTPILNTEI